MLFSDILGQEKIKEQFINTVHSKRISHAQLIVGPEGNGKLALAIAYAQYISCTDKKEHDSCGICPSCKKYAKLTHPDLHFVFPVIKTPDFKDPISDNYIKTWRETIINSHYINYNIWLDKINAENKQGSIYVNESTNILRKLSYKSYESEFKVMIIWLPEKMNIQVSNKLLKILEEPPEKTIFLLVSEQPGQLLQTILSRTQLIKVPKIETSDILNNLSEKFPEVPKTDISNTVKLSNGNYIKALNNLHLSDNIKYNFTKFVDLFRFSYVKDVISINKWVDEIAGIGREKQKGFFIYSLKLLRENFIMNTQIEEIIFLNSDERAFAEKFHRYINENNIEEIYTEFNSSYFHIERNANAKIVLFDMALKLIILIKKAVDLK